jgi:hypothetical protein
MSSKAKGSTRIFKVGRETRKNEKMKDEKIK